MASPISLNWNLFTHNKSFHFYLYDCFTILRHPHSLSHTHMFIFIYICLHILRIKKISIKWELHSWWWPWKVCKNVMVGDDEANISSWVGRKWIARCHIRCCVPHSTTWQLASQVGLLLGDVAPPLCWRGCNSSLLCSKTLNWKP